MKSLSPVAGKTIVIIGEPGFVSDSVKKAWAARQAVVVTGSVYMVTMRSSNETLACGRPSRMEATIDTIEGP